MLMSSFLAILLLCTIVITHCWESEYGCLEEGSCFVDSVNSTLISPGEVFELGFFTPDHKNSKDRYLGIWYYNRNKSDPKIVVWVANRDKPLKDFNGSLVIKDGRASVLDAESKSYWSTGTGLCSARPDVTSLEIKQSSLGSINNESQSGLKPINLNRKLNVTVTKKLVRLCLDDSGNLALYRREQGDQVVWRSFDNPTDTFLPGMNAAVESLNLTSWKAPNNPAKGSYVFTIQHDYGNKLSISKDGLPDYWKSKITPFDQIPEQLISLLLNNVSKLEDYDRTRLVMRFTGQIQFWRMDNSKRGDWSLLWSAPEDKCGLIEPCGSLGSCNSNNGWLCKCLPGTSALDLEHWNLREFSKGCVGLRQENCSQRLSEDVFLRMPMMKVKDPKSDETRVKDCESKCRNDCMCLAYSCGVSDCSTGESHQKRCMTWSKIESFTNLQEEYPGGLTLFVRAPHLDIGLTSRNCKPCGTYIIPYPLSTAADCGDSSYFNFTCNATTGQVHYTHSNLTYKITIVDPDAKKFTIQVGHGELCGSNDTHLLAQSLKDSLQYKRQKCQVVKDQSSLEGEQPFTEVEVAWKPPPEPACIVSSDCHDWPHTTCKSASGAKMKCKCDLGYHWDGASLKCIKDCPDWPHTTCKSAGGAKTKYKCGLGYHWDGTSLKCIKDCHGLPHTTNKSASGAEIKCGLGYHWDGASLKVNSLEVVVPCLAGVVAIIVFCGIFFVFYRSKRGLHELKRSAKFKVDVTEGIDVPFYDWETVLAATKNFAEVNKLGTGGFGSVYKGMFSDGQEIAVKRLSRVSMQGLEEFRNEVELVAKLQHRNLVRLIGYCMTVDEKILVYEYLPNRSLDSCLFDEKHSVNLDWEKRFSIILGIARGLLYLHQDSRLRIIHRDLKPSNILIDEELNPKISDFGIARIVGGKEAQASTERVVGTYGYMSPEYAYDGIFSVKSDVFSFGVVILQTISGIRNSRICLFEHGLSLLEYAWKLWNEDRALELMDPTLNESRLLPEVRKCIHIGLLCVQEDPSDRPTMATVVHMLGSEYVSLPPVKQPAFLIRKPLSEVSNSTVPDLEMMTVSTVGR